MLFTHTVLKKHHAHLSEGHKVAEHERDVVVLAEVHQASLRKNDAARSPFPAQVDWQHMHRALYI